MRVSEQLCGVAFAVVLGGAGVLAQSAPPAGDAQQRPPQQDNASNASTATSQGDASVTVIGCVQRERRNPILGVSSPSGFVLMNASTSAFGGSVDHDPETPTATGGATPAPPAADPRPRSGDETPPRAGGAGISPGLTFLLDGGDIAPHAGQRVEVRGTLQPTKTKLPLMKDSARSGSPNLPQRLVVASIKTLAKDCSR